MGMAQCVPGSNNLLSCGGRSHPLRVADFPLFPHFLPISFLALKGFALPRLVLGVRFPQESGGAERKGSNSARCEYPGGAGGEKAFLSPG